MLLLPVRMEPEICDRQIRQKITNWLEVRQNLHISIRSQANSNAILTIVAVTKLMPVWIEPETCDWQICQKTTN